MTISQDPRKKIWILFASQTGNSEQAARQIAEQLPHQCGGGGGDDGTTKNKNGNGGGWYGQVSSLDDFLELERAPWTPIVILCLSSYGAGQAPMGGHRFREFCDYIVQQHDNHDTTASSSSSSSFLRGLKFALLGLGDSKYTTFFENPTQTLRAMEFAGATRFGSVGKADASSTTTSTTTTTSSSSTPQQGQLEAMETWIANLWKPLNMVLAELNDRDSAYVKKRCLEWQRATCVISAKINPDFKLSSSSSAAIVNEIMMYAEVAFPVFLAILAAIASYACLQWSAKIPFSD